MDDAQTARQAATRKRKSKSNDNAGRAPKRPRTTKQGRLAALLTISLDIVFEIFGHLHPLDVLRLSRISKEFRALLMNRSSVTVWKASLNNVSGFPACPAGMSEPQWVSLAFDATCQVCLRVGRKVDWALFIRLCGRCAKTQLGSAVLTNELHEMIPTRRDPIKPYMTVYFKQEFERIKALYHAVGDTEEREKLVRERKELVETLQEHTKLCEDWSDGISDARSAELAGMREERYNAIVNKLAALGWSSEIDRILPSDSLKFHRCVKLPTLLTERTWKTIEPSLVLYMEQMKAKRLAREHAALVLLRKTTATKVLQTFKRSQLPWNDIMPGAQDFYEFPAIKAVLSQPSEVDVDEQSFESMLSDLPGMITTWREGLVQKLAKHIVPTGNQSDAEAKFKLATCVFRCTTCSEGPRLWDLMGLGGYDDDDGAPCRPLYWPRVLAHRCLTRVPEFPSILGLLGCTQDVAWRSHSLVLDKVTSEAVKRIVVACGMNPETTTVEEMDAADHRLACHDCAERETPPPVPSESDNQRASTSAAPAPSKDSDSTEGTTVNAQMAPATAHAFSWRNAVVHDGENHYYSPAAWYRLSDADAATARAMEAATMASSNILVEDALQEMLGHAAIIANMPDDGEEASEQAADEVESEKGTDTKEALEAENAEILPAQFPELAWSCAHCLDYRLEKAPMTLAGMLLHLATRHDVFPPEATLNDDYYRTLAAPEVYGEVQFPAPTLKVPMPPAPTQKLPPRFSMRFHDSDTSDYDDYLDYW